MKYRIIAVFVLSLFYIQLLAQAVEYGIVKEYNEKKDKTPLAAVDIVVVNAGTTISGKDGRFFLTFRTQKPGDKVLYRRIEKLGYEIFNTEALEQWHVSSTGKPFTVVMCKSEKFKKIRDLYNRIASESYDAQYQKEEQALRKELAAGKLLEKDFLQKVAAMRTYYDEQLENIDTYIEKIARIDLSELSSEEQGIIDLIQSGKMDAAIEAYEKKDFASLLQKENQDIAALTHTKELLTEALGFKRRERDNIYASISRQVNTYILAGGKVNIDKARNLLRECALSDTTNLVVVFDYANFAQKQKDYEEAEKFYKICLNTTQDKAMQGQISFNLGIIYALTHRFLQAEVAMLDALVKEEWRASLMPERSQARLAFVQNNIGSLYHLMNNNDKAILYLSKACESYQAIYAAHPQSCKDIYAQSLMNQGLAYRAAGNFSLAEQSYQKSLQLYRELSDSLPQKHLQNLAVCQLNHAYLYYYSDDKAKAEKEFQAALQNIQKATARNPYSLQPELGSTYNGLGLLYEALNRHDEALSYYLKALAIYKGLNVSASNAHGYTYARVLSNTGILYYNKRQNDKALEMLQEANCIFSATSKDVYNAFKIDIAKVSYNLGKIIAETSFSDAKEHLLKAHDILEKDATVPNNAALQFILMDTRMNLGIITMDDSPQESEHYFRLALPKVKQFFMTSPDEYRVQYATVLVGLVKAYSTMLTTNEDAYGNLIKYLPSAYKQCKILNTQQPRAFSNFYEFTKELMTTLNLAL